MLGIGHDGIATGGDEEMIGSSSRRHMLVGQVPNPVRREDGPPTTKWIGMACWTPGMMTGPKLGMEGWWAAVTAVLPLLPPDDAVMLLAL